MFAKLFRRHEPPKPHPMALPYPLWADPNDLNPWGLQRRREIAIELGIDPADLWQPWRDPRLREGEIMFAFNPDLKTVRPV